MKTFDETVDEQAETRGEDVEVSSDYDLEEIRTKFGNFVTRAVPEGLLEDAQSARQERRDRELDRVSRNIDIFLGEDLSIEDFRRSLNDLFEADLENANRLELLQVLAQASVVQTGIQLAGLQSNIEQIAELVQIREGTRPSINITISGTSVIETPNASQPVIPDSDDQNYDVTTLYIRSYPSNTEPIYFGDDGVVPESGFVLERGESIKVDMDFNDTEIYMASEEEGAQVGIMGVI